MYLTFYNKSELFDRYGNLNDDKSNESEVYVIDNFINNFPERMLRSQTSRSDKHTFGDVKKPEVAPEENVKKPEVAPGEKVMSETEDSKIQKSSDYS